MIGHRQIIEYRREGMRPAAIFIAAGFDPVPHRFDFENPERALDYGFYPAVTVTPDELGKHLDLRFCASCRVHVHGKDWTDVLIGLAEQLVEAGAAHVIVATLVNGEILEWKGEWVGYASSCA